MRNGRLILEHQPFFLTGHVSIAFKVDCYLVVKATDGSRFARTDSLRRKPSFMSAGAESPSDGIWQEDKTS